jgi:hypothetical protein
MPLDPAYDIARAQRRGETRPVDPELREARSRITADLRAELRTAFAELAQRNDRLEASIMRLEVRVSRLEGSRKPGRPRRRS